MSYGFILVINLEKHLKRNNNMELLKEYVAIIILGLALLTYPILDLIQYLKQFKKK